MPRLSTLTAAALAAASLTPAVAAAIPAGTTELRGAPQMRVVDADTVRVSFVNDDKVSKGRVVVSDHGTAIRIKANGRHGDDFKYVADVQLRKAMKVGRKYEVLISVAGDETPAKRLVVLKG